MNALKCRTLGTCAAEHTCMRLSVEGKIASLCSSIQCWKESGSATEQFQRKSPQISLYYVLGKHVVCRTNKLTTSEFEHGQTGRQTERLQYPRYACVPRVTIKIFV